MKTLTFIRLSIEVAVSADCQSSHQCMCMKIISLET